MSDDSLLIKHLGDRLIQERDKLPGHVPEDVKLRIEGGEVRREATFSRRAAEASAQFADGTLALGARESQEDFGALVRGRYGGKKIVRHIEEVLVDQVEECAGIAERGYVLCEGVQGNALVSQGGLTLQLDAGFVHCTLLDFLYQSAQDLVDNSGWVELVLGWVQVQGGGVGCDTIVEINSDVVV